MPSTMFFPLKEIVNFVLLFFIITAVESVPKIDPNATALLMLESAIL